MALYMVKARPRKELLDNLQKDLSSGKISKMRPFGHALQYSLENARIDNENPDYAMWVEEDYCSPRKGKVCLINTLMILKCCM